MDGGGASGVFALSSGGMEQAEACGMMQGTAFCSVDGKQRRVGMAAYSPTSLLKSSSEMTGTPSLRALSRLEPPPLPARR